MFRHGIRIKYVLAAALASGILVAVPGAAQATQPAAPLPVPVPSTLLCSTPWTNVIIGTPQHDELVGTNGNDLIMGLGGNDTIFGGEGRDTILGGDGDDIMGGGPGNDCIIGGAGADQSVIWMYSMANGTDSHDSVSYRYEY